MSRSTLFIFSNNNIIELFAEKGVLDCLKFWIVQIALSPCRLQIILLNHSGLLSLRPVKKLVRTRLAYFLQHIRLYNNTVSFISLDARELQNDIVGA